MVPRLMISSISPKENISSTYLISITSLPEDEQRLSMGEEVGTMQFRVQGEQIKICMRKEYIYIFVYKNKIK
jgi:hypothetical protein